MKWQLMIGILAVLIVIPAANAQAWWNSSLSERTLINITNQNITANLFNYTINFTINHSNLVSLGISQPNGNDIRVVANHTTELDRIPCFGSRWNTEATEICFRSQGIISGGQNDVSYYMYYDNNTPVGDPKQNGRNVYILYEDFKNNQFNNNITNITEASGCSTNIVDNKLVLKDINNQGHCAFRHEIPFFVTSWRVDADFFFSWNSQPWKLLMLGFGSSSSPDWDESNNFTFFHQNDGSGGDKNGYSIVERRNTGGTNQFSGITSGNNEQKNMTYKVFNYSYRYIKLNNTINQSISNFTPINYTYFFLSVTQNSGGLLGIGDLNISQYRLSNFMLPEPSVSLDNSSNLYSITLNSPTNNTAFLQETVPFNITVFNNKIMNITYVISNGTNKTFCNDCLGGNINISIPTNGTFNMSFFSTVRGVTRHVISNSYSAVLGIFNFTIFNETNDHYFNLSASELNNTFLTVYCPSSTTILPISSNEFQLNLTCPYDELRLTQNWVDGQFYRTLIPPSHTDTEVRFYMIDIPVVTENFQTMFINDVLGRYKPSNEGTIHLAKVINESQRDIIDQRFTPAASARTLLIVNERYILSVTNDEDPERIIGTITANSDATFTFFAGDTALVPDKDIVYEDIIYSFSINKTLARIQVFYNDTLNKTTLLTIELINGSNTSQIIETFTSTNSEVIANFQSIDVNSTYIVKVTSNHQTFGVIVQTVVLGLVRAVVDFASIPSNWLAIGAFAVLIFTALIFGPAHSGVGAFVLALETGAFYYYGWISGYMSFGAVLLVVLLGTIGVMGNRRGGV